MVPDYELVRRYQEAERLLKEAGYSISAISTGFFIHNKKGSIVADVYSVEGLRGFLQGLTVLKEPT